MQTLVDDARESTRELHDKWDTYLDFYQGNQTEGEELSVDDLRDWAPVNLVYSNTEIIVPILADAAPLWYVKALDPEHDEQAGQLTDVLQAIWFGRHVTRQYKLALRDQLLLGTGFLKPWWNVNAGPMVSEFDGEAVTMRRQGDIDVSWVDPYSVNPDPAARSLEECEYLCLSHDLAADRAKRLWPKFDEQQAQVVEEDAEQQKPIWSRALGWLFGSNASKATSQRQQYRVWEVYHEGGRRLTIYTNKQILWDGDNPTPGEAFPLAVFPMGERGYGFFGMPMTAQLLDLQKKINKWHLMMQQHLRMTGKTQWFTDDQQTAQQITQSGNRPGTVIHGKPQAKLDRLTPPQLPAWIFNYGRELYEDVKTVTGVQDVIRGLRPGSVQSGIGIQQLQESALTRPRDISRDNALQLEALGQIVLEFVSQYYTEERGLAYMRGSDFVRQTFKPEMVRQKIGSPEAVGMDDALLPEDLAADMAEYDEAIPYRVVVETGNSLPLNSMAQAELALRLFGMRDESGLPVIDAQALLDAVKFPRRAEVIARRDQQRMAMMQGQLAAQGMAAGGAPMGPEGLGPVPQQQTSAEAQALELLGPVLAVLSEQEQAVLGSILQKLSMGQPLTDEENNWMASLPPDVAAMLNEALAALGLAAEVQPATGPEMSGPMGIV